MRNIRQLLYAPALAALMLLASSAGGFASPSAPAEAVNQQATSPATLIDRWSSFIKEASRRFGVSEAWIKAVIRMESGGRTSLADGKPITSKAGAMGIMQIMPATYRDMRQEYGLGANPYDPHDNVLAGTAYLRWLYGKYGYPKMFAAYNAGPATLEAQLTGARNLPDETRAYVSGIAHILGAKSMVEAAQAADPVAKLTRPDGSLVSIDAAVVESIRAPLQGEYAPGVQSVLTMGKVHQGVREDLAMVASLIRSHGGKV